jgi:hypothetical protein
MKDTASDLSQEVLSVYAGQLQHSITCLFRPVPSRSGGISPMRGAHRDDPSRSPTERTDVPLHGYCSSGMARHWSYQPQQASDILTLTPARSLHRDQEVLLRDSSSSLSAAHGVNSIAACKGDAHAHPAASSGLLRAASTGECLLCKYDCAARDGYRNVTCRWERDGDHFDTASHAMFELTGVGDPL